MRFPNLASKLPPAWRIRIERLFDRKLGYRLRMLQNSPRVTSGFLYRTSMLDSGAKGSGEGGVIFDVGAHLGESSIAFALEFRDAQIHAFEPVGAIFDSLKHNCRKWHNIKCHKLALGSKEEDRSIQLRSADRFCSMNQMSRLANEVSPPELVETIHITTVDQLAYDLRIGQIAVLKIDVEGFELEVLRGARRMLNERRILSVMAETSFTKGSRQHVHIDDLQSAFSAAGYKLAGYYDPAYNQGDGELYYANALFRLNGPDTQASVASQKWR
jgi:FkbM family methyltransferase